MQVIIYLVSFKSVHFSIIVNDFRIKERVPMSHTASFNHDLKQTSIKMTDIKSVSFCSVGFKLKWTGSPFYKHLWLISNKNSKTHSNNVHWPRTNQQQFSIFAFCMQSINVPWIVWKLSDCFHLHRNGFFWLRRSSSCKTFITACSAHTKVSNLFQNHSFLSSSDSAFNSSQPFSTQVTWKSRITFALT